MALNSKNGQIFSRKPIKGNVYSWQPLPNDPKAGANKASLRLTGCSATPYSQGDDNNVGYTYNVYLVGPIAHRLAYVECDYVN